MAAAAAWRSPALPRVAVALVVVLAVLLGGMSRPAEAFVAAPIAPVMLAGAGVGGGAGGGALASVGFAGGAAAGGAAVAVAPLAIAAGVALVAGGVVYLGWRWAQGNSGGTAYDPVSTPAGTTGTGTLVDDSAAVVGSWSASGAGTPAAGAFSQYDAGSRQWTGRITGVPEPAYTIIRCATSPYGSLFAGSTLVTIQRQPMVDCGSAGIVYDQADNLVGNGAGKYAGSPVLFSVTGVAGPPPASSSAPSGTTTVTARPTSTCSGGQTVQGPPVTFTGGTPSSDLPPIVAPACPAGTTRTGLTVPATYPDGAAAPSPLAPWTAAPVPSGYPECQPSGVCRLVLTQTAVDGRVQVCNETGVCTGWAGDATAELVTSSTGARVQTQNMPDGTTRRVIPRTRPDGSVMSCTWGPYTVPAAQCEGVPTEAPARDPDTDSDGWCKWTLSKPWTWPYRALECAFVPPPGSFEAALQPVRDGFDGTALGTGAGMLGDVWAPLVALDGGPPADCLGPLVTIPLPVGPDLNIRPLNSCNELTQTVLGYWIPFASAMIYLATFYGIYRGFGRALGVSTPIVKAG